MVIKNFHNILLGCLIILFACLSNLLGATTEFASAIIRTTASVEYFLGFTAPDENYITTYPSFYSVNYASIPSSINSPEKSFELWHLHLPPGSNIQMTLNCGVEIPDIISVSQSVSGILSGDYLPLLKKAEEQSQPVVITLIYTEN